MKISLSTIGGCAKLALMARGRIHATYYMRICTNDNECILHTYLSDRLSSFGR